MILKTLGSVAPRLTLLAGLVCFVIVPSTASAITFSADFPSSTSIVVGSIGFIDSDEMGYFWSVSRGDSVTETFLGTGLDEVTGLDLDFSVTRNVLSSTAFTSWAVLVNGVTVGGWTWTLADGVGAVSLSYLFPSILGFGDYTIQMKVLNEVADGAGSIALGFPGDLTLTGTAVPEPSTLLLLGGALAGLALRRRLTS